MTDQELEQRLRNWYRAEISEAERAPAALRTSVAAIPQARSTSERRMPWRLWTMSTATRFAAAVVIGVLAVGGAFYVIQRGQPAISGPSPTPSASASPSESTSPSAGPSSSVVPARASSWTATGSMATPRLVVTLTLLRDGKALAAGGDGKNGALASAELYDPTSGTWTATGSMSTPRSGHTATLLPDGRVLVAGGGDKLNSAELYDPASGTWTATGNMVMPRSGHTATLLPDGKVLVAGGATTGDALASAELYDPTRGTWSATGDMVTPREEPFTATLLLDGEVLVAGGSRWVPAGEGSGGYAGEPLTSAELYDPASGTWTATGDMVTPHGRLYTATLLPDGTVLVAGGYGGASSSCCAHPPPAELYDPATRSWTATGDMIEVRGGHTATLLPDGKVLVAGGGWQGPGGGGGPPQSSAELYDPATRSWTATSNLIEAHSGGTAILLPDGTVLLVGGTNGTIYPRTLDDEIAGAELYHPGSGTR